MAMPDEAAEWAALQTKIAASTGDCGDWGSVSQSLRTLRAKLQQDLAAKTAHFDALESDFARAAGHLKQTDDSEATSPLVLAHVMEGEWVPEVNQAEEHFQEVMRLVRPASERLQLLDARAKYFEAAIQVETRSNHARDLAEQANTDALNAFAQLSLFAQRLPESYSVIRKEATRRVEDLTIVLKDSAVRKLQNALQEMQWPKQHTEEDESGSEYADQSSAVAVAFAYLLKLQLSQTESSEKQAEHHELWAMNCLLEPIIRRFRYHFERPESKTNRLAKPEWYLSHILTQTQEHGQFLANVITPELRKRKDQIHCFDAQVLFVRALIRAAKAKLDKEIKTLLAHKAFFCHTIDEVLLFEQSLDAQIPSYSSWANANREWYPRCVDVFTQETDTLFAWTKVDLDYAQRMLSDHIFSDPVKAWEPRVDDEETELARLIPRCAMECSCLLDFLCQRFMFIETDEHRYLYVTQVHHAVVQEIRRHIQKQVRDANIHSSVATGKPLDSYFLAVNAAKYFSSLLSSWEESSVFVELTRKVVQSEKSRSRMLQVHLEYSKTVFHAAQSASTAVLATEEAVAVRQAFAGPGAVIGPTAAFSAAYSVGSKTVKNLFGISKEVSEQQNQNQTIHERQQNVELTPVTEASEQAINGLEDDEAMLFTSSAFERQIADLLALVNSSLQTGAEAIVHAFLSDVYTYMESLFRTTSDSFSPIQQDVSSELSSSYVLLRQFLTSAQQLLKPECVSMLWKSIAAALDDLLFRNFMTKLDDFLGYSEQSAFSEYGMAQFVVDMNTLLSIFRVCAKNPRPYLPHISDLRTIFTMDESKLSGVRDSLDSVDDSFEESSEMEQITTIVEACGILAMTPRQIIRVSDRRLKR